MKEWKPTELLCAALLSFVVLLQLLPDQYLS